MPKTSKRTTIPSRTAKRGRVRDAASSKITGKGFFVKRGAKSGVNVPVREGRVSFAHVLADVAQQTRTAERSQAAQAQLDELAKIDTTREAEPKTAAGMTGAEALALLTKGAREAERHHLAEGRAVHTYDEDGRRTGRLTRARQPEAEPELEAEA